MILHYIRSKMAPHLLQNYITCLIFLLWQTLYSTAQLEDTRQALPVVNIREKRQTPDLQTCFGDQGFSIDYSIKETDPPGTILGPLPIQGIAYGANKTIELSLLGDAEINKYLRIDHENKTVVLAKTVDRDGPNGLAQLKTKITCTQVSGSIPYPLPYEVVVDIKGVNDETPMFLNLPYQVSISELTRIGTTVFTGFEAVDADGESRDGQVIYSIQPYAEDPDSNRWFTIRDAGRREIILARELDYERKDQWLVLLQARDNGNPSYNYNFTVVTINVLDGNDLPPIFVPCNATNITVEDCTNLVYSSTILERTPHKEPLDFHPGPVYAIDADANVTNAQPIYYTLYDGTPYNFDEYLSINSSSGEVSLLKPVCYNHVQRFDIEIKASEGPLPTPHNSSSFLAIGVIEKNEGPPEFNATQYIGYVYENSPVGTQIMVTSSLHEPLRIAAVDKDIDPACGTSLLYSLHDSSGSFILMEQEADSAYVVTNTELDREKRENYTLEVVAVEVNTVEQKESQPTKVTIVILDRNDNTPYFLRNAYSTDANRYKVEVRENHPVEAPVMQLQAYDPDSPYSDYIHISFEYVTNPNGGRPFTMQRIDNTSVAIVIEPGTYLVEGERHVVSLQATDALDDTMKSPVVYVEMRILPSNASHAPRFGKETYTETASEGLPVGVVVTQILATDLDEDDVLTYDISSGNEDGSFHINPQSGEISILKELDRETTATYTLNITAFDGNLTSTAILIITVLDINDNNPQFNSSWPTSFLVLEGKMDEFVGQVMAYDIDEKDTKNSEITYELTSDHFTINSINGSIYTKVALDRETQDRYKLSVVARDTAAASRSSQMTVTVIIQDVNDNGPVFDKAEYSVEITEEHIARDFITLTALDRDQDAVLEYSITSGNTSVFTIDKNTGAMSLIQHLDYETERMYRVNVTVTDIEIAHEMKKNSTTTVIITVTDVNDNKPIFTQPTYSGSVLRTADLSTVVISDIVAIDGDMSTTLNGQVQYRINPPNDWFTIPDPAKGTIVTKSSLELVPDFFNLTVVAFDKGTPPYGSSTQVTIDVRVEKPIFSVPVIRVNSLMENAPVGSHVVDVIAVANKGDIITYSIITDDQDIFRIESVNNVGKIYTTKILDREEASSYKIDVQAVLNKESISPEDPGVERRRRKRALDTNVVEVIIELGDLNDNPPEFPQDRYFIGVSQDAGVSTTIITMQAIDSDSGNNSILQYSLESNPLSTNDDDPLKYFTIGVESGIISTWKELPSRAEATSFDVVVLALEKFGSDHDPASTIVSIALINNLYRAVLVGTVPPDITTANLMRIKETLQQLLDGALVFVEEVSPMKFGENLDQVDPSGSDTIFYAINTTSGLPLQTEKIINKLMDHEPELNAMYSSIVSNGSWIETRHVGVGKSAITDSSEPTIEAIALICLGIVLFVCCVLAIVVIIISWKKREMEREKQARVYLPMYNGSGFNPYASNNEDMEMGNDNLDEGLFASANPVYFDDQSVQVTNDELFPNGEPTFLREAEVQFTSFNYMNNTTTFMTVEATMEFTPEESDEEGNAVANSIAAACVGTGSDRSSLKDLKDTYPPSSGPPSYTSQDAPVLPNLVYDADSLPRKIPPEPERPPPPPPAPSEPPPAPPIPVTRPAETLLSPAYVNQGVDLADEHHSNSIGEHLPATQPRSDSLPKVADDQQGYSPSEESSFQNGRKSVEPNDDPNIHLVKIYRPPSRFGDSPSSHTDSLTRDNHDTPTSNGGIGNHVSNTGDDADHKKLPNGKANGKGSWEPEEVLTTAL